MKKIILISFSILIILIIFLSINFLSQQNTPKPNESAQTNTTSINDQNPPAQPEPNSNITLTGELIYVHNNGKQVLLSFYNPHQGHIAFIIEKENWNNFPATFQTELGDNLVGLYSIGQVVSVTGSINYYQGDEAIYITDPSQIKFEVEDQIPPEEQL